MRDFIWSFTMNDVHSKRFALRSTRISRFHAAPSPSSLHLLDLIHSSDRYGRLWDRPLPKKSTAHTNWGYTTRAPDWKPSLQQSACKRPMNKVRWSPRSFWSWTMTLWSGPRTSTSTIGYSADSIVQQLCPQSGGMKRARITTFTATFDYLMFVSDGPVSVYTVPRNCGTYLRISIWVERMGKDGRPWKGRDDANLGDIGLKDMTHETQSDTLREIRLMLRTAQVEKQHMYLVLKHHARKNRHGRMGNTVIHKTYTVSFGVFLRGLSPCPRRSASCKNWRRNLLSIQILPAIEGAEAESTYLTR